MIDLNGTPPKTPEEIANFIDEFLNNPNALGDESTTETERDAFRAGVLAGASYAAGTAVKTMHGTETLKYLAELMTTMARWAPK